MKFSLIATILGASSAISIDKSLEETQLIQEAESLEETCKDMHTIDESSLLEIDDEGKSED